MKYLQIQSDGTITDCISFPHGDYVPFEGETPQDVMGGWYKLVDGKIVEFPELKPTDKQQQIEKEIEILKIMVADLALGNGGLM